MIGLQPCHASDSRSETCRWKATMAFFYLAHSSSSFRSPSQSVPPVAERCLAAPPPTAQPTATLGTFKGRRRWRFAATTSAHPKTRTSPLGFPSTVGNKPPTVTPWRPRRHLAPLVPPSRSAVASPPSLDLPPMITADQLTDSTTTPSSSRRSAPARSYHRALYSQRPCELDREEEDDRFFFLSQGDDGLVGWPRWRAVGYTSTGSAIVLPGTPPIYRTRYV